MELSTKDDDYDRDLFYTKYKIPSPPYIQFKASDVTTLAYQHHVPKQGDPNKRMLFVCHILYILPPQSRMMHLSQGLQDTLVNACFLAPRLHRLLSSLPQKHSLLAFTRL
jgi:hypothetical protein